ncbi:hypothetical protein [Fodinicurvata halophila]|uniref:hypothetical protein n=1 Tax=Fodinicurvata halophila TaxID=1419723 RepID=UPI00363C9B9C
MLGLLHLDQYRQSLIDSEQEAMRTQATTVALALGSAAVRDGNNGEQELMHDRPASSSASCWAIPRCARASSARMGT